MTSHIDITSQELHGKIRKGIIAFGGNRKLKIYGTLGCKSGRRMKEENRVFFTSEEEAIDQNYRSCGHCMKLRYNKWQKLMAAIVIK